ncbi:MAG: hypothetical protein V1712_03890 [Patescibacteria group bacterium]
MKITGQPPQPAQRGLNKKALQIIVVIFAAVVVLLIGFYIISSRSNDATSATGTQANRVTVIVPGNYTFQVDLPGMQNVGASASFTPSQTTFGPTTTGQSMNNASQIQQNQPAVSETPKVNF